MAQLFMQWQRLLPQRALSRLAAGLADSEIPWLKTVLIRLFVGYFGVDVDEAAEPGLASYASFNAFFTRSLRAGARPVADNPALITCPADGSISQIGRIAAGKIFQAKGRSFSTAELLTDAARAQQFADGEFVTIYLSPRDYHRVHMPISGVLSAQTYIPGTLFSVGPRTTDTVPGLFARNERLVCYFDTVLGPLAVVLVGAMIVAGIETVWSGPVATPQQTAQTLDFTGRDRSVQLPKGAEMGHFKLGSTVILLFPGGRIRWEHHYRANSPTRLGEALARIL